MNKNKKKFIIVTSIYILFLLIITTSFAWFFINKELEIDYASEITCEAGTSLEIAMLKGVNEETQEEEWTDFSGYVKYTGTSAKIEDITGDGKNLYRPTAIATDPETGDLYPEGFNKANKTNSEGYGEFLEIEVKLRTTSTMNVLFSGNSLINPVSTSDTDRNIFGRFSKDYIAAASRVAVLTKEDDGTEELKMIWAPNPNVELIRHKSDGTYELKTDGAYENYCYYKYDSVNGEYVKYYVTEDDYVNKRFILGSTKTNEFMINNSPIITKMSPEINEFVEQRLVIRVWFEGTDREADQALGGGYVKLNLKFIGMQEKTEVLEENKVLLDDFVFTKVGLSYKLEHFDSKISYSLNGYSWAPCSEVVVQNLNVKINQHFSSSKEDLIIYLKCPETTTEYEYIIKKVLKYGTEGDSNEATQ